MTRGLLSVSLLLAVTAASAGQLPLLTVGRAARPPLIDGRLTDAAWGAAAATPLFCDFKSGRAMAVQTTALLAWDAERLYVAFDCVEPAMARLRATMSKRDDGLWGDDCVEVFLRRPGEGPYQHFIVNPQGALYDSELQDASWSCAATAAAVRGDGRWSCELSVPWGALGGAPAGEPWTANLCRCRRAGEGEELSCWSVTGGSFHNAAVFGHLRFAASAPALREVQLGALLPGANRLRARVAAPAASGPLTVNLAVGGRRLLALPVAAGAKAVEGGYALAPDDLRTPLLLSVQSPGGDLLREEVISPAPSGPAVATVRQALARLAGQQGLAGLKAEDLQREGRAALEQLAAALSASTRTGAPLTSAQWAALAQRLQRFADQAVRPVLWVTAAGARQSTLPVAAPGTLPAVNLALAGNERESVAVYLSGALLPEPRTFRLSVPDPRALPPAASAAAFRQHLSLAEALEVPLRGGGSIRDPLSPLSPAGTIRLGPGETREVWVTASSEGLPPGYYVTDLVLSPLDAAGGEAISLPLRVRVWPLELPREMPIRTFTCDYNRCWNSPAHLADLLAHRTNVLNCNALPEGTLDFGGVAARVAPVRGKGLLFVEVWFMRETGWRPEYEAWVRGAAKAMEAAGVGYEDWVLHIYDETMCDAFLDCARHLKTIEPRIRIFSDFMGSLEQIRAFAPYVDYWCPYFGDLGKADGACLAAMRATGKPVWTYECGSQKTMSVGHYRALPWLTWEYGLDGSFFWCYPGSAWDERPIADLNYGHIYEGYRGEPVGSKRWEAWGDGLDDYLLLRAYGEKLAGVTREPTDDELLRRVRQLARQGDGDPAEMAALRTRVAHRLLALAGTPAGTDFPEVSFPGWTLRSSGDGRGSGGLEPGGHTNASDLAMALRCPTARSWVFTVKPLSAKPGQKVRLSVWVRGAGRLRTGVCEGFNFGGNPAGHRLTDRYDNLTDRWRQVTVEHTVQALPVEAFIGFDYGQSEAAAMVSDVDVVAGQ